MRTSVIFDSREGNCVAASGSSQGLRGAQTRGRIGQGHAVGGGGFRCGVEAARSGEPGGDARTVAALFCFADGAYSASSGVEVWDIRRDARLYAGPHPVVAHPPCRVWSRAQPDRSLVGKDGDCFRLALAAVREWGGVLEHPASSAAWTFYGLNKPPMAGGWVNADFGGLWTCHVEQGHYGHPCRKATWLLAFGCELPSLRWGPSSALVSLASGFRSDKDRSRTPGPFRDLLLAMARSACR